MRSRPQRRDDGGSALIIVIIVSMIVGSIVAVSLNTGRQADWSSASDRNHEGSLGVAEAGVQQEIKRIQEQTGSAYVPTFAALDGSTSQGTYHVETTRCPPDAADPSFTSHQSWCVGMAVTKGYVMDSTATAGVAVLKRTRHIRVSLVLPTLFPANTKYALFSSSSINLSNNDSVNGLADIYANGTVTIGPGVHLTGSVTSALGAIDSGASNTQIDGNAWSGGFNTNGTWAMDLTTVLGWAKASVPNPVNMQTCDGQLASNYAVVLGVGKGVAKGVTTWGTLSGASPRAIDHINTCTAAAPQIVPCPPANPNDPCMPTFTYNKNNYNPPPVEIGSATVFNTKYGKYATTHPTTGTFVVYDANPSPTNPIDLSGWSMSGDLTVITNTPIYSSGITDTAVPPGVNPTLVLVSHYAPTAADGTCDTNSPNGCAIYIKNGLNLIQTCATASLFYADNGPIAIKNTNGGNPGTLCGSVVSGGLPGGQGISVDNSRPIYYDTRVSSIVGFGDDGPETYKVGRWEELPAS